MYIVSTAYHFWHISTVIIKLLDPFNDPLTSCNGVDETILIKLIKSFVDFSSIFMICK